MSDLINIEQASVKVLKAELDKLGVAFKAKAKADDLRKLLAGAQGRVGLGVHAANDPLCEIFSEPKAGHPACLECLKAHGKRYDACVEVSEEKKKEKKDEGKERGRERER